MGCDAVALQDLAKLTQLFEEGKQSYAKLKSSHDAAQKQITELTVGAEEDKAAIAAYKAQIGDLDIVVRVIASATP